MNKNLLNISGKISEPIVKIYELIAEIANKSNVRFFVIGATARDMVFEHGYGIPTSRATKDIDLAVQVATWDEFQNLKNTLIATGYFAGSKTMQRMFYQNQIPIDIAPFGAIENKGGISWPPDDSVQMNVTGFNDAYLATQTVRLRESPVLDISVVSPAALVILKLLAWKDRSSEHSKDAIDLAFILRWYLNTGHTERLAEEHSDLLDEDCDFERSGARMLGRDVASIISTQSKQMLDEVLNAETENNLALLKALYLGLSR